MQGGFIRVQSTAKVGIGIDMGEETNVPVIHCGNCRKQTGYGELGSHWICEDCRLSVQAPTEESCIQAADVPIEVGQTDDAYAKKAR